MKNVTVFWISVFAAVVLIFTVVIICHSHTISAFEEDDIKRTSYMIIKETSDELNYERVEYDKSEIRRITSLLSDLKYVRKTKAVDSGGYSFRVIIYDAQGNKIRQIKLLSEDMICVEGYNYYLRNRLNFQEVRCK